jgi:outer membrane protein assembly factor BamB
MGLAALLAALLVALLAGCGGASRTHAGDATGVFLTAVTHWSPEHAAQPVILTLAALALNSGAPRWQHREEYSPYHGPTDVVVSGGVIYLVADTDTTSTDPAHPESGVLLALHADDGSQLWRTEIGTLASSPLLDGDTVYVTAQQIAGQAGDTKIAYALDARDGSIRWRTPLPNTSAVEDSLALSRGRLFVASSQICFDSCNEADLFALDAAGGQLLWRQAVAGNITALPPLADGDQVYFGVQGYLGEDSHTSTCPLIAYSAGDGHQLWRRDSATCSGYLAANGLVYTADGAGADPTHPNAGSYALLALDGATGALRWQTPSDPIPRPLALQGARLFAQAEVPYVATGGSGFLDELTALDAATGKVFWKTPLGATHVTAQVGDGAIFVGIPPAASPGQDSFAAFDAAAGSQRWHEPIGPADAAGYSPGLIASHGDLLFAFAGGEPRFYAVRAGDGSLAWSYAIPAGNTMQSLVVAS